MGSLNPFAEFRESCQTALKNTLNRLFPEFPVAGMLESPPNPEFGELSSSICFELAKQTEKKPITLANQVAKAIDLSSFPLIQEVKAAGAGYINFYVKLVELSRLTIESVQALDADYGHVKTEKSAKIIVEHTSVNPIHPINVGQARNPILGDCLARLLKARGHTVVEGSGTHCFSALLH